MVSLEEFEKTNPDREAKDISVKEKEARAAFYATNPDHLVEGKPVPTIPGSSLRGMIREIVEILSYSRMRWVSAMPYITFRAIAASRESREDPLTEPYRALIGSFSRKVQAGYLHHLPSGSWQIHPAQLPRDKGWPEQGAFLKVKEDRIPSSAITGFKQFNREDYKPRYSRVSFGVEKRRGKRGESLVVVTQIGDPERQYLYAGTLVCSGNMLETASQGQPSPRKNHALILSEDPKARPLPIPQQVLKDYSNSLTNFQRQELWGGPHGCLQEGAPVFYLVEGQKVLWFGHTPNFRVPALNPATGRVATPLDFVPESVRRSQQPDMVDAIFGWVEEKDGVSGQRAGRVFVSDAQFIGSTNGVWLTAKPLAPSVLGGPKATTFQHYLVQDKREGHNPDDRKSLAHYGSNPATTAIRGYKLYWHKGANPRISATEEEMQQKESQLTRIAPLKPGVQFTFRVYFENLHDEELGALAWALQLPGEPERTYCHKVGMGKPLGMGAVAITARLHLTDRKQRYARFVAHGQLVTGEHQEETQRFIEAFEKFVLREKQIAPTTSRLAEVERIRALLILLEWREGSPEWLEETRYQLIEHPQHDNEYKERPVLPDPLAVRGERATFAPEPHSTASADYKTGTVKDFGLESGRSYGFLIPDGEPGNIFVHVSNLSVGLKSLQRNQRVIFKIRPGRKGLEAYDVRLAE